MTGPSIVRVAVSGVGFWSESNHLPWLRDRSDVELVGAYDPNSPRLAEVCARFDIPVAAASFEDLLGLAPDAIVVASPPAFHARQAELSLRSGAHVLCEKPFTIVPEDAWDLVELAASTDRTLMVAYGWNEQPIVEAGRRLLEEIGIGRIEQVVVHMASYVRAVLSSPGQRAEGYAPDPATYTEPMVSGGGYAPAQLTHAIGLALHLTGEDPQEVIAATNGGDGIDLHDAAVVRYRSGAIGTFTGASCWPPRRAIAELEPWPPHQLSVRLYGSDGQFCLDLERDELWLRRERDDVHVRPCFPSGAGRYRGAGPLEAFIATIVSARAPARAFDAHLGARTVAVVDAILRSAEAGEPVIIGPRHERHQ